VDPLGEAGSGNVQGEQQQKLDVISNQVLLRPRSGREGVAIVASEDNEEPVMIRRDPGGEGRYCVLFDPLDGSPNLDVCGGVGTIFSVLRHAAQGADPQASLLQQGREQVAAGYVLDPSIGVFLYPPTQRAPAGKLRLMYEANPLAMLIEQAGGKALSGPGTRILDVEPRGIQRRTPVILGSAAELRPFARHGRIPRRPGGCAAAPDGALAAAACSAGVR